MDTPSGIKDSIPAWIKFSVQAPGEIPYNGIYYDPPEEVFTIFFRCARYMIGYWIIDWLLWMTGDRSGPFFLTHLSNAGTMII